MKRLRSARRAALCAFAFAFALAAAFATTAFAAEEYPVMVGGVVVTSNNADDVLEDGTVKAVYDADAEAMDLYLSGAGIPITNAQAMGSSADAAAIYSDATKLTIHLEGENTLSSVGSYDGVRFLQGICVEGADVEIVGPGSLDISIVSANITEPTLVTGIYAGSGDVTISDKAVVFILSSNDGTPRNASGINTVDGGSVRVVDSDLSVYACNGGMASIGIEADAGVHVSDSNVVVMGRKADFSCGIRVEDGDLIIDGDSAVDAIGDEAINESSGVSVGLPGEFGVCLRDTASLFAAGDESSTCGFGVNSDLTVLEDASILTAAGGFRAIFWDLDLTNHLYKDAVANNDYDLDFENARRPEPGELLATEESYFKTVFIAPGDPVAMRLAGDSANETSAAIATFTFGKEKAKYLESDSVVIARDDDFADALGATGLAGVLNCPIVLTDRESLSPAAADAIKQLRATKAYIIGGEGAMKAQLVDDLAAQCGITDVERLWGEASYDTSLACAEKIASIQPPTMAIAAMSMNFQDALSISPIAYKLGLPVILQTWGDTAADRSFTDGARAFLADKELLVAGGVGAISEESLAGLSVAERLWGETGYDTSLAIAKWGTGAGYLNGYNVVIACGAQAPRGVDALAGSALAGKIGAPILLVNANEGIEGVNTVCTDDLADTFGDTPNRVFVLGGTYVVPPTYFDTLCEQVGAEEVTAKYLHHLVIPGAFDEL